jgi:hypothetical protein
MVHKMVTGMRDAWLMVGIALVLFFVLEGGYRLQAAVRGSWGSDPPVDSSGHPYAGQQWFRDFHDGPDGLNARNYRLDPYRGHWPAPLRSPNLNIDSSGKRLTVRYGNGAGPNTRIFMFGGSSMWGFAARDSFTIPSLLSAKLADRGFRHVEIVNLAQAGFNSTQEVTTLLVELAGGNIPDIAVFLNGYNDIATGIHWGAPGHSYAEDIAQRRVDLGKRGFWGEITGMGRHSKLIQRFTPRAAERKRSEGSDGQLCEQIAQYYRRLHLAVKGLADEFGFHTLTFHQPHHATAKKTLTSWERSLGRAQLFVRCSGVLDSVMADRVGISFFQTHSLFAEDSQAIFVDKDSHISEFGNGKVAEFLASLLTPYLQARAEDGTVAVSPR